MDRLRPAQPGGRSDEDGPHLELGEGSGDQRQGHGGDEEDHLSRRIADALENGVAGHQQDEEQGEGNADGGGTGPKAGGGDFHEWKFPQADVARVIEGLERREPSGETGPLRKQVVRQVHAMAMQVRRRLAGAAVAEEAAEFREAEAEPQVSVDDEAAAYDEGDLRGHIRVLERGAFARASEEWRRQRVW